MFNNVTSMLAKFMHSDDRQNLLVKIIIAIFIDFGCCTSFPFVTNQSTKKMKFIKSKR